MTCLLCQRPVQKLSCFCLEHDGGNVAQAPATKWVRCVKCATHEAMPGRRVCEGCAS